MEIEDWLRISRDLASQALRLERRQGITLRGFEDILREERSDTLQRQQFNQRTHKKLNHVKDELSRIQKCIQDVCSASADPRKLQDMLERFEASMTEYKASMRVEFTALAVEEASLTSELDGLSGQILDWERESLLLSEHAGGGGGGGALAAEAEAAAQQQRIQERQAVLMEYHAKMGQLDRKLISMGGRTGGWDSRDHDAFLKVLTVLQHKSQAVADEIEAAFVVPPPQQQSYLEQEGSGGGAGTSIQSPRRSEGMGSPPASPSRHTNAGDAVPPQSSSAARAPRRELNPSIIAKFIAMVPGKTPEEIEDHLRWHFTVAFIQNEKKRLLAEWREEKAKQQPGAEESSSGAGNKSPGGDPDGSFDSDHYFDEARLAAKRAQVEEWRRQKAAQKKQEEMAAAEEQARQLARAEEEAFLRKQQNRLRLEQWKEVMRTKEQSSAVEQSATVEVRSKSADPAEIRRRQERDKEMALKRLEKTVSKQSAVLERERRLKDSESKRVRWEGPSKLLDPTTAHVRRKVSGEELDNAEYQRQHGSAHSKRIAGAGYDLKFTGRAIPTWRKGLF